MPDYSAIGWGFLALAVLAAAFLVVVLARLAKVPALPDAAKHVVPAVPVEDPPAPPADERREE